TSCLARWIQAKTPLDKLSSRLAYRAEAKSDANSRGWRIDTLLENSKPLTHLWMGIYREYTLIASPDGVLAVPVPLASWDLSHKALRHNPRILKSESVSDAKRLIDSLIDPSERPVHAARPELKLRGFCGHNIYYYESRYFAVL